MITKEDLYIIHNGERKRIDLISPSGITLKFLSNLFTDLSKFCASYSYTFKLPRTLNNMETFDLVEDIRHDSSFFGKRIPCEYYRDGIKLFDNAFLYVNESGKEYSALMTWNVLSWLKQVSDDGLSIKDLEKDLGGSELTTLLFRCSSAYTSQSQSMGSDHVDALYRCGTKYENEIRPPLIPVRYLLDKIAQRYGKTNAKQIFSFMLNDALSNTDLAGSEQHNIVENGAIPLVDGKWSNKYAKTQICQSEKISTASYNSATTKQFPIFRDGSSNNILYLANRYKWLRFGSISGSNDFVKFYEAYGSAISKATTLDVTNTSWTINAAATGLNIGFCPIDKTNPLILRGRIRTNGLATLRFVKFHYYLGQTVGSAARYVPQTDDDGNLEDTIEISVSEVENMSGIYEFNFDPEEGGQEIEIEKSENDYTLWAIQLVTYDSSVYITDGYLKFIPYRDNISMTRVTPAALNTVDLFSNLPDIKIIDFLKALFYIENAYPILENDGRIGQIRYKDLYTHIQNREIYDWSLLLTTAIEDDSLKYTNGNLGQSNLFCMKNYSDSQTEEEQDTPLEYEKAVASFATENEHLDSKKTIFTFPYASAAKITKNGYSAGDTFIFWEREGNWDSTSKVAGSITPIIGRIVPYNRAVKYNWSQTATITNYLRFAIWQVTDMDYPQTILAKILRKPYVITTKIRLDAYTLSTIDFSKPVYIDRYNSFFGIISLQLDSKGMTKAELVKLPPLDDLTESEESVPEIEITGSNPLYKTEGRNAVGSFQVEARVKKAWITRMVVKIDGSQIFDGACESFSYEVSFESGADHPVEITAYSSNGLSATKTYTIHLAFVSDQTEQGSTNTAVDFLECPSSLTIGKNKRNVQNIRIAAYNYIGIQSLKLYKYPQGSIQKDLVASGTTESLTYIWEYYDQLSDGFLQTKNWIFEAEFTDNNGTVIRTTKNVSVSIASNIAPYFDGVATGIAFQMESNDGNIYNEGQYKEVDFGSNFNCYFAVYAANCSPYYVLLHFKCYRGDIAGAADFEFDYGIDPSVGISDNIEFLASEIGQYHAIRCTAKAWFNDDESQQWYSGEIWLYNILE